MSWPQPFEQRTHANCTHERPLANRVRHELVDPNRHDSPGPNRLRLRTRQREKDDAQDHERIRRLVTRWPVAPRPDPNLG